MKITGGIAVITPSKKLKMPLYTRESLMLEGSARKNNLYLPTSTTKKERRICEEILIGLQNELHEHNPYIRDFIEICKIPEEEIQIREEKEKYQKKGNMVCNQFQQ